MPKGYTFLSNISVNNFDLNSFIKLVIFNYENFYWRAFWLYILLIKDLSKIGSDLFVWNALYYILSSNKWNIWWYLKMNNCNFFIEIPNNSDWIYINYIYFGTKFCFYFIKNLAEFIKIWNAFPFHWILMLLWIWFLSFIFFLTS